MEHDLIDYAKIFAEAEESDEFWIETAKAEFTDDVVRLLQERRVTHGGLARLIGVDAARISKILRGDDDFRLDTMVKLARALGARLSVHLEPGR